MDPLLNSKPPDFGHPMLEHFGFAPGYINLNNGSYGSLPNVVKYACEKLSRELESAPDRFMRFTYKDLLKRVREQLSVLIGAEPDECVMVSNATSGINTVLRNLEWREGDVIVLTSVTYGAVERTVQYLTDVPLGPQQRSMSLKFPISKPDLLKQVRTYLQEVVRECQAGCKVVGVFDGIVASPGVQMPWEEIVKICREEGVMSVIDAAHSIGQQVGVNLKAVEPDFWVSNCHKWLFAKRGCAVLYVPKRNQHLIKTSIPTSWSYVSPKDPPGGPEAPNFIAQFDKNGTIDMIPFLSVTPALEFRHWLGGEKKINTYCHDLAIAGGKRLAEILQTCVLDENGEFTPNMVNVKLPLDGVPGSIEINGRIMEALLFDWSCYAAHYYHNGSWWVRCSAQIWNDITDFEYLGKALGSICSEIKKQRDQ